MIRDSLSLSFQIKTVCVIKVNKWQNSRLKKVLFDRCSLLGRLTCWEYNYTSTDGEMQTVPQIGFKRIRGSLEDGIRPIHTNHPTGWRFLLVKRVLRCEWRRKVSNRGKHAPKSFHQFWTVNYWWNSFIRWQQKWTMKIKNGKKRSRWFAVQTGLVDHRFIQINCPVWLIIDHTQIFDDYDWRSGTSKGSWKRVESES